jgi:hypothetical protein
VKPRRRIDSLTAAVGDVAGALHRRRLGRAPYVRLHDERGRVRALDPLDEQADALLDAAAAMVDAADAAGARAEPDAGGDSGNVRK